MQLRSVLGCVLVLSLAVHQASARGLKADAPKKPEFVFSNELLTKSLEMTAAKDVPPLPEPTPGGRAGARKVSAEDIGCLNNAWPAPLSWPMWCAGENATVEEYYDAAGAMHKIVTLKPQPGLTPEMALFYQSGAFPQYLDLGGKRFFWYHLWHPIDHIYSENRISLNVRSPLNPDVKTLIHEAYRNDPGSYALSTNMLVDVVDVQKNLVNNRTLAGLRLEGKLVWQLLVTYKLTPQGTQITCEYVLGAPEKGWDPLNPDAGFSAEEGRAINMRTIWRALAPYRANGMYEASDAAITRHTIEEFSNLGKFLPLVWDTKPVKLARLSPLNPLRLAPLLGGR